MYPVPAYYLNYYQYDGIQRGKEYYYDTNNAFFDGSMIAYHPRHSVNFWGLRGIELQM